MPHKMNARSCERINGFMDVLRGFAVMTNGLAGSQWNEGDVSCSVVRRVALPGAFFAADGLFQTLLTVLGEFGAYPAVIGNELRRYLPFLATTKILMAAVQAGVGREVAHTAIKRHAVAVALEMRQLGRADNDLLRRLAADEDLAGVDLGDLQAALSNPIDLTGAALPQVMNFVRNVEGVVSRYPQAAGYRPASIL